MKSLFVNVCIAVSFLVSSLVDLIKSIISSFKSFIFILPLLNNTLQSSDLYLFSLRYDERSLNMKNDPSLK